MTIRPIGKRLLILIDEEEQRVTGGGIYLPKEAYFDRVTRGQVRAVSKDVEGFKQGDRVVFSYRLGVDVGDGFKIVRASDVLGVEDECD